MRTFAWLCVVMGLLIAPGSAWVIAQDNRLRQEVAFDMAKRGGGYRAPTPTALWPGVLFGLALSGFGVLVLAIRPPERRRREREADDDDDAAPISFRRS